MGIRTPAALGGESIVGPKGDNGARGREGEQGQVGPSNYQVWLAAGNVGTPQAFLATLKGDPGPASTVPGPTGPTSTVPGPAGPASTVPGPAGADGRSAYQVWLDAGNSGTVAQYLAAIKGAKGDTGPVSTVPGPAGTPSTVPGPKGEAGTQGIQGAPGIQGIQGPIGPATSATGLARRAMFASATALESWVVPFGVTRAFIEVWGGGGGGASSRDFGGAGSGGYVNGFVDLIAGESLQVEVGQGGAAGTASPNGVAVGGFGQAGARSRVYSPAGTTGLVFEMRAQGGDGASQIRGASGGLVGSFGDFLLSGTPGTSPYRQPADSDTTQIYGGTGGNAPRGGRGGRGGRYNSGVTAEAGEAPGGGGGTQAGVALSGYGGVGAAGRVVIWY